MKQEQRKEHSDKGRGTDQRFGNKASVKIADGDEQSEGLRAGRDDAPEESAKQIPSECFLSQDFWG